jgi:hypothetical protein
VLARKVHSPVGAKTLDHRTDVFSLVVMQHEMIAGKRRFHRNTSPISGSSGGRSPIWNVTY